MTLGRILIVLLGVMATAQQWPFRTYPAVVSKHKPAPLKLETLKAKQHITAIRKAVRHVQTSPATTQWWSGAVGPKWQCMSSWTIPPEEFTNLQKSPSVSTSDTMGRTSGRTVV